MYKRLSLIVCSVFVAVALAGITFAEERPETSKIEVLGTGRVMVMPNVATISFAVETNSENAEQAVKENAKRTGELLAALKRIAGEEAEIRTSGFSLSPVYEKQDRLRPSGYRVTNRVLVETKSMDKLGALLDGASQAGASRIGSLTFSTDKEDDLRREAAVKAVHQAKQIGNDLAKAANLTIQKIIKLNHTPTGPVRPYRIEAATAATRTPIEIGEISIEERVSVVFAAD
jgi:uncharacterized protein YggE